MPADPPLDRILEHNHRSLQTLIRTIRLTSGHRFKPILAHCNGDALRELIQGEMATQTPIPLTSLTLTSRSLDLYQTIARLPNRETLTAVEVVGVDTLGDLDRFWITTNHLREEFRKHFSFPLVLWVNDRSLTALIRQAPDFHNWAAPPISFTWPPEILGDRLRQETPTLLAAVTQPSAPGSLSGLAQLAQDLAQGFLDLEKQGAILEGDLLAYGAFLKGERSRQHRQWDLARMAYQASLDHWQAPEPNPWILPLGQRLGEVMVAAGDEAAAVAHLRGILARGLQQPAPPLGDLWNTVQLLGMVLVQGGHWEALDSLIQQTTPFPPATAHHQARMAAWQAQAAAAQGDWLAMETAARRAVALLAAETSGSQTPALDLGAELAQYPLGRAYQLLAQAQQRQGQLAEAIASLQQADAGSVPQSDRSAALPELRGVDLHLAVLRDLRQVYREAGDYIAAYEVKQRIQAVEQQAGRRAFVGVRRLSLPTALQQGISTEIIAADREADVNRILQRLNQSNCKLLVVYGPSGVGKSSTVNGGLVPALGEQFWDSLPVVPLVQRRYKDWDRELGQALAQALGAGVPPDDPQGNPGTPPTRAPEADLFSTLQALERGSVPVLVFDQFEEFFFACPDPLDRRRFWGLVSQCLMGSGTTRVVLSLREDYLHYLLECERLAQDGSGGGTLPDALGDILSTQNRYYLGNFKPAQAQAVIQQLTQRAGFMLEPALVERVVADLGGEAQAVRPVELQIVGS